MPTSLAATSSLELSFSPAWETEEFSRAGSEREEYHTDMVILQRNTPVGARLTGGGDKPHGYGI